MAVGNRTFRIIPIAQLTKADWNYKKEDEALSAKLAANMKRNGQVETLLVRLVGKEKWEVVNGNHRLDALIALGVKSAAVCDLGKISKAEAMRLAVETNETRFETDYVKLSSLFKEIKLEFPDEKDLLETMPFDERQLSDIQQITEFDWPELEKKAKDVEDAARKGSKVQMIFNFSIKQANVLNNWFVRSGKDSREEAIMVAVEKSM